ncbi:MAG: hypothetical protein M9892_07605 [Bacteroidetes bacterium]|nr:hypothetical protein [Bacteroidota bacterium]
MTSESLTFNEFIMRHGMNPNAYIDIYSQNSQRLTTNPIKVSGLNTISDLSEYSENGYSVNVKLLQRLANRYEPKTDIEIRLSDVPAPISLGNASEEKTPIIPKKNMNGNQGTTELLQFIIAHKDTEIERLRRENDSLTERKTKLEDENRDLRVDVATLKAKNEIELLGSNLQHKQTLGGIVEDVSKPETISAIADLVAAVKGIGSPAQNALPSNTENINTEAKEALAAIKEIILQITNGKHSLNPRYQDADTLDNMLQLCYVFAEHPEMPGQLIEHYRQQTNQE